MRPRSTTFIVVLTIVALGSWFLSRDNTPGSAEQPVLETLNRGYYIEQARILGTGVDGGLLYEIEAERAEQQADKRVEFSAVRIQYSPNSSIPWTVIADNATLREGAPRIVLQGDVQILNNETSVHQQTEIRTEYLELDPERFIAETSERVHIRFGTRSVTATGMLASLHDDRVELRSNVRGEMIP